MYNPKRDETILNDKKCSTSKGDNSKKLGEAEVDTGKYCVPKRHNILGEGALSK